MTTQTDTSFDQDYPQRRPYHLLAGSLIFVLAYTFALAFVRIELMPR